MAPKIVVHVDSDSPVDVEINVSRASGAGSSEDKASEKEFKGVEKRGSSSVSLTAERGRPKAVDTPWLHARLEKRVRLLKIGA